MVPKRLSPKIAPHHRVYVSCRRIGVVCRSVRHSLKCPTFISDCIEYRTWIWHMTGPSSRSFNDYHRTVVRTAKCSLLHPLDGPRFDFGRGRGEAIKLPLQNDLTEIGGQKLQPRTTTIIYGSR